MDLLPFVVPVPAARDLLVYAVQITTGK